MLLKRGEVEIKFSIQMIQNSPTEEGKKQSDVRYV
jgi:hypothetical protein